MLAIERRNDILEKLQAEKRVVVSELSQLYQVSEETIRRDLEKLENEGLATKSYGGAVINEQSKLDLPLNIRKNRNVAEKQRIAELVAGFIHDGESIMLDASSTAVFVARALKHKKELTVITNSIEILIEHLRNPEWSVLSTGGLSKEGSFALVGPQTDKMLKSYHVDTAVISGKGLDMEMGLTDSDEFHANNKRTMLQSAGRRILAVDSSKFDKMAFTRISEMELIDIIVTDRQPDGKWLQFFTQKGIECVYPEG